MKTYLVGGAVRDELLGLPVTERDWVVVGATPDDMLALGYQQVGKSFPVFLHPRTREEYALARTERKIGTGHTGFECDSSSSVTLEQDLFRRDLTINAIARDNDGTLVDVTGGIEDIEHRLLRHVGEAFAEDPLRVLRVARFAAKLAPEGFCIAPETFAQCQQMVARGDLGELTPERVFLETEKALKTTSAHTYFSTLALMKAATLLWPELDDNAIAALAAYEQQDRSRNPASKFAILFLRIDAAAIASRCDALRTPDLYRQLAMLAARHHEAIAAIDSVSAEDIVGLIKACDAIRRPDRFRLLLDTIATQSGDNKLTVSWLSWFELVASTSRNDVDAGLKGPAIGEAITALQVKRVADYLATSR